MRLALLSLFALLPSLLFAGPTASQLKDKAMHGDLDAQLRLACAYASEKEDPDFVPGLKKDPHSEYVWLAVYMSFEPNSSRGIKKQASWLENDMAPEELRQAKAEAAKLAHQIESISAKKVLVPEVFE